MKKNLLYIITIVILCVGVLIFSKKEVKQTPAMRENGFNLIRSDVGVENHVQDVSGIAFTMTYPENTTISEVYNTYRIQNYTTKDPLYRLKPNEFFLDVIVYDHSKNKYMEQSCESMLVTKEKFTKNTPDGSVSFYIGTTAFGGGEDARTHALCFDDEHNFPTGKDIWIQGTSGDTDKMLIQTMFKSFQLSSE